MLDPRVMNDRTIRTITSLCTDLRGFSKLFQDLTPMALADLLDTYYEDAAAIVGDEGGRVDTFLGDSVLAHFTASPDETLNAETRAVTAALRLKTKVAERWSGLSMSVGIATGAAVVGHFGPSSRRFYTAFGDVVSRAVALERRSHVAGFTVLVDRQTRERLSDRIAVETHITDGAPVAGNTDVFEVRSAGMVTPSAPAIPQ